MKKFLTVALGICLAASNVSAEQPKAQEYREILSSEKFYVEYDDDYVKKIIVEDNGRRMSRVTLNSSNQRMVSILNPLATLFSGGFSKYPDFMYYKNKYFKFSEKETATMARAEQLHDENLNPSEGWALIDKELALPDELAIFNWNERHHKVSENISAPIFSSSTKKNIDGKEYNCDRYEAQVTNAKDTKIIFDMCYNEKGALEIVESAILTGSREYHINKLTVKKIQSEIPKDAMALDLKAKIYAAGIGDMNDLLENPVLLGKLQDVQDS